MPQEVFVKELDRTFEFPDEATQEQINAYLKKQKPQFVEEVKEKAPDVSKKIDSSLGRIREIQADKTLSKRQRRFQIQREMARINASIVKDTPIGDVAKFATLFAAPEIRLGRAAFTTLKGAGKLAGAASKVGFLSALFKGAEEIEEGADLQEAGKQAAKKAASDVITSAGVGVGLTALKKGLGSGIKLFSRVDIDAVDASIKDPSLLKGKTPSIQSIGEKIDLGIDDLQRTASKEYKDAVAKIGETAKESVINPEASIKQFVEKKRSLPLIKKEMVRVAKEQARDVPKGLIDKYIKGQRLTFDEADDVYKILRNFENQPKEKKELIAAVSGAKKKLLEVIEDQAPGTRAMKKQYAEKMRLIDNLRREFGADDIRIAEKQTMLESLGRKALGKRVKKDVVLSNINKLEDFTGKDIIQDLKKRAVDEEFEKVGDGFIKALKETQTIRPLRGIGLGETGTRVGIGGVSAFETTQPVAQRLAQAQIGLPQSQISEQFVQQTRSLNEIMFGPKNASN